MRPLFLEYPADPTSYEVEDQYLLGRDLLVAPVLEAGACRRNVYLPLGSTWTDSWTGEVHDGGRMLQADAPLERIPLFLRDGARLPILDSRAT
jgi:alpha-D-xyloside xylohydrolase